jgi:hypothetical protein
MNRLPRGAPRWLLVKSDMARGTGALPRGTLMRVNSTNVQYEGLRIGEVGRQMNSKVRSVKQGVYQK